MNKIEELLTDRTEISQINGIDFEVVIYNDVVQSMKAYAEHYAKRCLEEAEYQAGGFMGNPTTRPTQIKLPEHE